MTGTALAVVEHSTEAPGVQLTRMEGKFDLLMFQVTTMATKVDKHDDKILELTLNVATLTLEAESRDATVISTAKALKDAKDTQDSNNRAAESKSELSWAPLGRMVGVITVVLAFAALYLRTS